MINIEEFTFLSSDGQTRLHAMLWLPEGEIRGILQIAHGVAEHDGTPKEQAGATENAKEGPELPDENG